MNHAAGATGVAFLPDGQSALSSGGGRNTANQGANPGIDFALRLWRLPEKEVRVAQPK